ncbi:MAG: DUF4838 domain-containing protein [Flavobacterium sp.]
MRKIAFLLLCIVYAGCASEPADFRIFSKGTITPEVVFAHSELKGAADSFCRFFEEATGVQINPTVNPAKKSPAIINIAFDDEDNTGQFRIMQVGNEVIIEGGKRDDVDSAIRYFFSHFVHLEPITEGVVTDNKVSEIVVPSGLQYVQEYAFEYREPYFPDNFQPEFRKWNNTHTLEENWGLWGHNIGKVIAITPEMHATAGGKKTDEQLCFSSPELREALVDFIKSKRTENPAQRKFMIMPYDNDIACTCSKCTAAGNTAHNASPAVFTLLNRLSKKFPDNEFFSTAYITTQATPKFSLEPNAGVMVSTMQFPKGVVIEKTAKKAEAERTFNTWRAVTGKIFLWDYAVNFDNYFDAYPTVRIAQQNLKFYKKLGVTGVFMHGSEENYSAFGSLKCYLYAQLLQNPDVDIEKLTRDFYTRRYPAAADVLASYYLLQESRAFDSPKQLDIYGGMKQSEQKYLDAAAFANFYDELVERVNLLNVSEAEAIKPLFTALTFQRLEIMRIKGLGADGFGMFDGNIVKIKPQVEILLDRLARLSAETGIKITNESGQTIADYIRNWRRDITPAAYRNLMFGKRLKLTGIPDEEYTDMRMLTDGATGFTDYYNNWMLTTAGEFSAEVHADEVRGLHYIEISFLNDPRHNIHYPEKVVVTISGRKYEAKLPAEVNRKPAKKAVKIAVTLMPEDEIITIQTVKQPDYIKKSVACDEVFFK